MNEKTDKQNISKKNEANQNSEVFISDKKFVEYLLKNLDNPQVQRKILKIVIQAKRNGELN